MSDTIQELILPFFRSMSLDTPLLDPEVSEIMVNTGRVFVEKSGRITQSGALIGDRPLRACIETIAHALNDSIDDYGKPWLDARLPGGERIAALYPPASPTGPMLTIRKFLRHLNTAALLERGALVPNAFAAILNGVSKRKNILFAGGTSTGKTTMANAFLGHVSHAERLLVIEKPIEMQIEHPNCARLEAYPRLDSNPPRPEMTESQLLKIALRHRPDRIILGEVRDSEAAYALVQAMNTGHDGTFSTIHANTAASALHRLASLARPGFADIEIARDEVATAVGLVVEVKRDPVTGWRGVNRVIEVDRYDSAARVFRVYDVYTREGNR